MAYFYELWDSIVDNELWDSIVDNEIWDSIVDNKIWANMVENDMAKSLDNETCRLYLLAMCICILLVPFLEKHPIEPI